MRGIDFFWLGLLFPIAFFMVVAMVEFTLSLLTKRPPANRKPVSREELMQRLLGLNNIGSPYKLVESPKADLELQWDVVDASWYELFAKVKLTAIYRARMLLDEQHHEVRWFEYLRTSNFWIGLDPQGWKPRFNWSFQVQSGFINIKWRGLAYGIVRAFPPRIGRVYSFYLDTVAPKNEMTRLILSSGWTFRPVSLWFQVSRRSHRLGQGLAFPPLRKWSARKFWGVLYVGAYALFFVVVFAGLRAPLTANNIGVSLGISAIWWATWGLLTWVLLRFPGIKRRKRRKAT